MTAPAHAAAPAALAFPRPADPAATASVSLSAPVGTSSLSATEPAGTASFADLPAALPHAIRMAVRSGAREAVIDLRPPELGAIHIRVQVNGAEVAAHLTAERPAIGALLERMRPELGRSLKSSGFELRALTVTTASGAPHSDAPGPAGTGAEPAHAAPSAAHGGSAFSNGNRGSEAQTPAGFSDSGRGGGGSRHERSDGAAAAIAARPRTAQVGRTRGAVGTVDLWA